MNKRTCGNCRWWNRYSGEASGDCQRHPPVYNGEWARTDEVDFCGEWADKTITPEQEERRDLIRQFAVAVRTARLDINVNLAWAMAEKMVDAEPRGDK